MGGQSGHQDALMATRETTADPGEPLHTLDAAVIDQGNGSARITVPSYVRDLLDVDPGDELELDAHRDHVVIRKKEE